MKYTEKLWAVRTKTGGWRRWRDGGQDTNLKLGLMESDRLLAKDTALSGDRVVRVTVTYEVDEP